MKRSERDVKRSWPSNSMSKLESALLELEAMLPLRMFEQSCGLDCLWFR